MKQNETALTIFNHYQCDENCAYIVTFIMDRIFRGIMKYIKTDREKMVEQFVTVRNNPEVKYHWYIFSKSDGNLTLVCSLQKKYFFREVNGLIELDKFTVLPSI